ncbi:Peroxidasin [Nymphon striatum]|nr:Peroxidasin [Nymphon striatum]
MGVILELSRLQETCPGLHDDFLHGRFSVQLRNGNPFARIAVDQTTEETVNKDTQTARGTRDFSLKPGAVSRYYLTAGYRAGVLRQPRQEISTQGHGTTKHTDLEKTRIKRDELDVASMVDLLENNWTNPFGKDPSDLVCISTETVASTEVTTDMVSAHEKGEHAYKEFEQQRLQKRDCFHDPIKKIRLKTFSIMKNKPINGTTKEIAMKADRRLFGNMVLIAQSRKMEMHDVLSHPLGPLPWTLANGDGTMKKTNKAVLIGDGFYHVLRARLSCLHFSQKAGKNRSLEKSSETNACLSHLVIGVSSLLQVTGKNSLRSSWFQVLQRHLQTFVHEGEFSKLLAFLDLRVCLGLSQDVNSKTFIRRGSKSSVRLVDITKLATTLGNDVCTALIGLHPWTGCYTSAFAGQEKQKSLKILLREQKFIDAFATLGTSWNVTNELFFIIEQFVCQLCCRNTKIIKVNQLQYQMFHCRRGEIESAQLPPCEDTLTQHTRRANYQAAIWRRSFVNSPDTPDPSKEQGWTRSADGSLMIHPDALFNTPADNCLSQPIDCSETDKNFRTADGSCNNLFNSDFGSTFTPFRRMLRSKYGVNGSIATGKPNPRTISLAINSKISSENEKLSLITMQFGQFLDHDITHTPIQDADIDCCDPEVAAKEPDCAKIDVPDQNDPLGTTCLNFVRSLSIGEALVNNRCKFIRREQVNQITSFIDGSNIYGSDDAKTHELRSKTDSGDDRANEQVDLALMHTIFMREHNKIVDQIRNLNYDWDNDRIFYEARKIVAAQLQVIVYKEYLPAILGEDFVLNNNALNINRKTHYKPWINPGIFNEFATAAFRFGHSMIRDNLPWPGHKGIELSSIFFKPYHLHFGEHVIGELTKGLVTEKCMKTDNAFSTELTDNLFRDSDGAAFDLVALNIQRGRDHGLQSYQRYKKNSSRQLKAHLKVKLLNPFKTFTLALLELEMIHVKFHLFSKNSGYDLFIGGICEKNAEGAAVGPLFRRIMSTQFKNLRRGDRFFFNNGLHYSKSEFQQL